MLYNHASKFWAHDLLRTIEKKTFGTFHATPILKMQKVNDGNPSYLAYQS